MIRKGRNRVVGLLIWCAVMIPVGACGQTSSEREFPQTPAVVKKIIQRLTSTTQGRLPTLVGFAENTDSPDRYQRGYYQCSTQVLAGSSGGSIVKVKAKITAWYQDPKAASSGYRILQSNGRLEADFLDQLADALNSSPENASPKIHQPKPIESNSKANSPALGKANNPTLSAPMPGASVMADAISSSRTPLKSSSGTPASGGAGVSVEQRHNSELEKEAQNLQEILRNQAHPKNLAAVKKDGTPVMSSPNEGAQVLFQADAEDEFEMLEMNSSWVHVRISGLSRGWILRSALELPGESGDASSTPAENLEGKSAVADSAPFQVESEQITSFPGNWDPLRGKTVKIISVQKTASAGSEAQAKLAYAKFVFSNEYSDISKSGSTASGVVVVFDSDDGGMMAATMPVLKLWKSGSLSDEGLWRRCYFDPPEAFASARGQ